MKKGPDIMLWQSRANERRGKHQVLPIVAQVENAELRHLADLVRQKLQLIGAQGHDCYIPAVANL